MSKFIKLTFILALILFVQSCASFQCNKLVGKEKKACIARVNQANAMNGMMSNQAAMDAGNAAAQGAMMPPPMMH